MNLMVAASESRTHDLHITSVTLCQLSYSGGTIIVIFFYLIIDALIVSYALLTR